MYNNRDNLEVGKDYYNLSTGEYVFTMIYDGNEEDRIIIEGIPSSVKSPFSDYMYETFAYNKDTLTPYDEDDVSNFCYNNIIVDKDRLEAINTTKQVLVNLWEQSGIQEPFIFEDGKFSIGKEQVLSAHINAGREYGWISSSICW